jgi:hypothetical protein
MTQENIRTRIAAHCTRYPQLESRDLLKFLHHSAFGCGHLIQDASSAEAWLQREMDTCGSEGDIEYLCGGFCRVHLGYLKALGVSARSFARLFALSAEKAVTGVDAMESLLTTALNMAREGLLPFSYDVFSHEAQSWQPAGYPATHHSEAFRAAYRPAYRVLHTSHAALLPLLAAIDRKRAAQEHTMLVIEGGAGSGKSTLAALLQRIYGCTVLHMDDFFLRGEQRTPQRYATPGGNIDHERFLAEVVTPLKGGETFRYRPFDCATFTVAEGYDVMPDALTVVEGCYSMHPDMIDYYDCRMFLHVNSEKQMNRIRKRNPDKAEIFRSKWIPLEEMYFQAYRIYERADIVLQAERD